MELDKLNIATRTTNALKKKGIFTTKDLIEFTPRKYHKYGLAKEIWQCQEGEYEAVICKQLSVEKKRMNVKNKNYLMFKFQNITNNKTFNVMLFYNVFLFPKYYLNNGKTMVICGRIKFDDVYGHSIDDISTMVEAENYKPFYHSIYSNITGVSDENLKNLRDKFIYMAPELLEKEIVNEANLMPYKEAMKTLHYPQNDLELEKAKERLRFNDLFYFALSLKANSYDTPFETRKTFNTWEKAQKFVASLPFELTKGEGGQAEVLNEIFVNAKNGIRNNILLQGDVGCGKTIVAATLMVYAEENGYQSVLMAPRGVLARQHYDEISSYADKLGIKCAFLHSDLKAKERKELLKGIENGEIKFIIGTHSCISKDVKYKNLGAVITDEEHLFGVKQKEALIEKAKEGVHSLSMSATPIPRTMASVIYGDQKEIKIISKKPAGRKEIITKAYADRKEIFAKILEETQKGHQAYVVCPAIEDNPNTDLVSIEAIENEYKAFFEPLGVRVGIVNGKMKAEDAKAIIDDFKSNEVHILIATTVIEVGVNVPNATTIAIEQANNFGLASLHQLRGRVGRCDLQSYCMLLCDDINNERIKVMCETNDGFKIAQADLEQRGTGDLIGTAQSGVNKYVEEMLNNANLFTKVESLVNKYSELNYGNILKYEYEEHLRLEDEYNGKKNLNNKC